MKLIAVTVLTFLPPVAAYALMQPDGPLLPVLMY